MYEEDRIRALELYNDIFDEAGNETAVLQLLISPTRQAVNLARAYDAKDRGPQEDGATPGYLQVIEQLRFQAQALAPDLPKPDDDQISLFDPAPDEADTVESPRPEKQAAPAPQPVKYPGVIGDYPDEDKEPGSEPLRVPPAIVRPPEPPAKQQDLDEFADAVEAFLADFTINDDTLTEGNTAANAPITWTTSEDTPAEEGRHSQPLPAEPAAPAEPAPVLTVQESERAPEETVDSQVPPVAEKTRTTTDQPRRVAIKDLPDLPELTEKKPVIPLLIVFILFAIPLGLLCAGVILTCALASLSLAASLLGGAVVGFGASFTAFSVFADILLVFGLSLAAAAFSLLFFWIFVWLLIGALPGLVRGICALARKLCYKEVAV